MGFFKSINELQKQAKEIEKEMPPVKDRMADAVARMQNATAMMAEQTAAAGAAANGLDVTVMITSMRQVGLINLEPLIEFELTAMPDGRPPYPASTRQAISQIQLSQLRAGSTLLAKVDPANPSAIWLDLTTVR